MIAVNLQEIKVGSTYYYKGKIINMKVDDVCLPDGQLAKREEVEHPGGCAVAALTGNNELLMVRQYRYAYQQTVLEIPAGKLEAGEKPFETMKRELLEETGCTANEFAYLGCCYPTPGYTNEKLHIWACRISGTGTQHLDPGEYLEVVKMPLEQAVEMVMSNEIRDAKTQIGVLKTAMLVKEEKL